MSMIAVHHDPGADETPFAERVVQEAMRQAEQRGWQGVRLSEVAAALEVPMARVLEAFRDLDAVADAWFRRGWAAMFDGRPEGFAGWPAQARLEYSLMAWFDALAAHRRVTLGMLRTKAHPPHPHTWVPMLFDLSRTVQWWREAAGLEARYGSQRARLEELALTALFLAALAVWTRDDSLGQARTRRFLERRLARGNRCMRWVPGGERAVAPAAAML